MIRSVVMVIFWRLLGADTAGMSGRLGWANSSRGFSAAVSPTLDVWLQWLARVSEAGSNKSRKHLLYQPEVKKRSSTP